MFGANMEEVALAGKNCLRTVNHPESGFAVAAAFFAFSFSSSLSCCA